MASAGRVLPINKGTYNSVTTYAPLDIVYYNEGTYCCKKACTNVTPAEGEYWQKWVDVSNKVDKITGKGLSTNDFTNAEKAKVDNAVLWSERKGYVGKNFIQSTATSGSNNGVTWTVNSDKSITINTDSAATADTYITIMPKVQYVLPEGDYILSDEAGSSSGGYVFIYRSKGSGSDNYSIDTANNSHSKSFTVNYDEYDSYGIRLLIKNGATISNRTFYPMIRLASIADGTYEPYLPSNEDLIVNDITSEYFGLLSQAELSLYSAVSKVYKIGRLIVINAVVERSNGYVSGTDYNFSFPTKYSPAIELVYNAHIAESGYAGNSAGVSCYLYLNNAGGGILKNISPTSNNWKYIKINLAYICKQ